MNARIHPYSRAFLFVCSALLLSGCGEPPPTDPMGGEHLATDPPESITFAGSGDELPFHLSGTGALEWQELAPDFGPPDFGKIDFGGRCSDLADYLIQFSVTAEAIHLGTVEVDMSHCGYIDFQTGVIADRDGRFIVTAPNGDELHIGYEGHAIAGAFDGRYTITGGTGRFIEAAGSGTFVGMADRSTGTLPLVELDGVISFDASGT